MHVELTDEQLAALGGIVERETDRLRTLRRVPRGQTAGDIVAEIEALGALRAAIETEADTRAAIDAEFREVQADANTKEDER